MSLLAVKSLSLTLGIPLFEDLSFTIEVDGIARSVVGSALATLGLVAFKPTIVEVLIPITIMITALVNLRGAGSATARPSPRPHPVLAAAPNALALGFGLIHGLGFSNYLRALLGADSRPIRELLAFNVGEELGQVLIVAAILLLGALLLRGFGVARRDWLLTTSGAALGIAIVLLGQLLWP